MFSIGKFNNNTNNDNKLFVVGNGDYESNVSYNNTTYKYKITRSNAFTVNKAGDTMIQHHLTLNNKLITNTTADTLETTENDNTILTTKSYVDKIQHFYVLNDINNNYLTLQAYDTTTSSETTFNLNGVMSGLIDNVNNKVIIMATFNLYNNYSGELRINGGQFIFNNETYTLSPINENNQYGSYIILTDINYYVGSIQQTNNNQYYNFVSAEGNNLNLTSDIYKSFTLNNIVFSFNKS